MNAERFDRLVMTLARRQPRSRPRAAAPSICIAGDRPCTTGAACCSGVCTMHGRCACFEPGHLCPDGNWCCSGHCDDGTCR